VSERVRRAGGAWATLLLVGCTAPAPSSSLRGTVVDSGEPTFSNPTVVDAPLLPVTAVTQSIALGTDHGEPLRVEVTLLPETRAIEWNDQQVETVASQFVSYRGGRILEVATDYFAQADDGSVWYFGEEVDNYADGTIADHGGSWLAGRDGPPGMIMPADPHVGDVFHPENIPGLVFEEVIVVEVDVVTDGPSGEITGAIRVSEHLMEGTAEEKIWAPGYGEFHTDASAEELTVALAVPTDARDEDPPAELARIADAARRIFEAATSGQWASVTEPLDEVTSAWQGMEGRPTPPLLADQMRHVLDELSTGVEASDGEATRHAAVATALAALDIEVQYRDPAAIDLERMAFWARRLSADVEDMGAVRGDVATLETIWARASHAAGTGDADAIDEQLAGARTAVDDADLDAIAAAAEALIALLTETSADAS
jgi:hypothetical protein